MIVCCGEALFDVFFDDEDASGALRLEAHAGGSPFNVSIGIARLGGRAALFTGVSNDLLGSRLSRTLEAEGVETRYLVRSGNRTTISLVGVDDAGHPGYVFYGLGSADCSVTEADVPVFDADVSGFHFGSYSLVARPVADAFQSLLSTLDGRFVSLDPNVRATVESDLDIWRSRIDAYVPSADLIKVSAEDLGTLYPDRSPEALAESWLSNGVRLVIITDGREKVSAWTQRGYVVRIAPPYTEVVDTVGAGDSFQAALLAKLSSDGNGNPGKAIDLLDATSLEELVTFAVSAARITCSRRGADLPRLSDLSAANRFDQFATSLEGSI